VDRNLYAPMLARRANSKAMPTTTMIRVRFIRWVLPSFYVP